MRHANVTALVLCQFLVACDRDRVRGVLRPLSDYQRRYPGFEVDIAREYAALEQAKPAARQVPCLLGTFRGIREIARGGQGTVYEAWDPGAQRQVAVKVLALTGGGNEARRARFRREAEISQRVGEFGFARFYGADLEHEPPYFAMELVRGATLGSCIEAVRAGVAKSTMDVPVAPINSEQFGVWLRFFETVARDVFRLHAAGIAHRDIKPDNLMVTPRGQPLLIDFGAARFFDDPCIVTSHHLVLGTRPYMAPERLHVRKHCCDALVDQFSLGSMMFDSLALRPPVLEVEVAEQLEEVFAAPGFASLPHAWTRRLAAIFARTMAHEPANRYRDCLRLAADLRGLAAEVAVGTRRRWLTGLVRSVKSMLPRQWA